jgi:hypothetical protein
LVALLFPGVLSAQQSCSFVPGTQLAGGVCATTAAELLPKTTAWIEARIAEGSGPNADELAKLKELIEAANSWWQGGPKLHIVRAWYGHLGTKWSEGSQCSATRAVRTSCERKSECAVTAAAGGTLIDPVPICGFDPAPVARGLARGLVVQYSCESGDPAFWDKLLNDPLKHPDTREPYDRHNSLTVVLRTSAMKIRCRFPATAE